MFNLIDSHSHIQFPVYDEDRDLVVSRAREAGVGVVNVGTQASTSLLAITVAEQYPDDCWATAGFHPGHLNADAHHDLWELKEENRETFDVGELMKLAAHPKVVAIGECGLDYYRADRGKGIADSARKAQQEVFRAQIELALELQKPLVIHCRQAFPDLVEILKSHFMNSKSNRNGVAHFFSGSLKDAENLLALGFSLGFGGVITFPPRLAEQSRGEAGARDYDEAVKKAPLDRILIETDAPYVTPVPYRGKRNEPVYVVETARKIAEIRGISYDEVTRATTENARRLFGI